MEDIKPLEKPSEKQKNAGETLRFINTVESGQPDEAPTTLESRTKREVVAGNTKVDG